MTTPGWGRVYVGIFRDRVVARNSDGSEFVMRGDPGEIHFFDWRNLPKVKVVTKKKPTRRPR